MATEKKKSFIDKIPTAVLIVIAMLGLMGLMFREVIMTQDVYFETCGELCEAYDSHIGIASKYQCTCLTQDNEPLRKEDREAMSIDPGEKPIPSFIQPFIIEESGEYE